MLNGDEAKQVAEDLRRATSYSVNPSSALAALERVCDRVAQIIEQIEFANGNGYYKSPYADSAAEGQK